jgi:hypothetical protein
VTLNAPAFVTLNPYYMEPEFILQQNQASGAFETLPGGVPKVRLGEETKLVYMKRASVRTISAASQSTANELPGVSIVLEQISTPTYRIRTRYGYDHHDVGAGAVWGLSVPQAYQLGSRQAHFQLDRDALLYGMNPANGEGILNAAGAFAINLPPDTFGNTSVVSYDNGQAAQFIDLQVGNAKDRLLQLGIGRRITILMPQRIGSQWGYNIVQLTSYQRPGAGTTSTAGVVKSVLMDNGDELVWCYDDTLQGKGAGGTDAIVIVITEIEPPENEGPIDTNVFAKVSPGNYDCTAMYMDMAAPREIISPMAGGATDTLTEQLITSGWGFRPESITIISALYSH